MVCPQSLEIFYHLVRKKLSLYLCFLRCTGVVNGDGIYDAAVVSIGADGLSLFHRMQGNQLAACDYFDAHFVRWNSKL